MTFIDNFRHKKHDTINMMLIIMIRMIIIILAIVQMPDNIDTIEGIIMYVLIAGIILAILDLFIPDIIGPSRETFFLVVGMKILRI